MSTRIKYVYDLTIAVEMTPEAVKLTTGYDAIITPNGKSFCPLGEMKAGAVIDGDAPEKEAISKAIRTACYFFKQENPEWSDSKLVGLSPERVKAVLV